MIKMISETKLNLIYTIDILCVIFFWLLIKNKIIFMREIEIKD